MTDGNSRVLERADIESHIPHRYPMLLIDRIIDRSPGRCVAVKNVGISDWFFEGHFPGRPIMPGCLLAEAMAQAGNFLGRSQESVGRTPVRVTEAFLLSSETRFLKAVLPGDQIIITARLIRRDAKIVRFKSDAHVSGEIVATGTYVAMVHEEAG